MEYHQVDNGSVRAMRIGFADMGSRKRLGGARDRLGASHVSQRDPGFILN